MLEQNQLEIFKSFISEYHPISDGAFALIEEAISFKTLEPDEVLLHIGEVSRYSYFTCEGAMIAYFMDEEGNTYNKNIFLERQMVGSTVSAILRKPSQFTLQAIEKTVLICIHYESYRAHIFKNDELKTFYIKFLEKNWVIEKEQREISIVMESATTRYLKLLKAHPDIDKRIPLLHIASHLGITPTQLSRIRKNLKKNKSTQHR